MPKSDKKARGRSQREWQRIYSGQTVSEFLRDRHPILPLTCDDLPYEITHYYTLTKPDGSNVNKKSDKSQSALIQLLDNIASSLPPPIYLEGNQHQAVINSNSNAASQYHVIRFNQLINRNNRKEAAKAFVEFESLNPFKHRSKSKTRTQDIHPPGTHMFHPGYVRRQGNSTGLTKDFLQTSRKKADEPTALQLSRREACTTLLVELEKLVLNPIRRHLQNFPQEWVTQTYKVNHHAHQQSLENGAVPAGLEKFHFQGLATALAIGRGDADKPHLDKNDSDNPSLIIQLAGPTGYTHFPQLNLTVEHKAGDVIVAPTSSLLHFSISPTNLDRIMVVFYVCRHVESEALSDSEEE